MKYKALIVGAGRIGAGYKWHDLAYTHAGAYAALKDRVELVGFVEPDSERAYATKEQWGWLDTYETVEGALKNSAPIDIISVCTQPETQPLVFKALDRYQAKAVWCEKPYWGPRKFHIPTQVNFMRRADPTHRAIASQQWWPGLSLRVTGKLDHHTLPHFEDLARWWNVKYLHYTVFDGPCSYSVDCGTYAKFFDNGGVDGGACFKGMLTNILDFLDNGTPLWSPAP